MLSIVSYLKETLTENWYLATVHKEVIDVLRHCSSGKTLGEILGEVKISSQVITQTENFLSNKIVLSKSIVLN